MDKRAYQRRVEVLGKSRVERLVKWGSLANLSGWASGVVLKIGLPRPWWWVVAGYLALTVIVVAYIIRILYRAAAPLPGHPN